MESLESFRAEVGEWLEANCPASQRRPIIKEEQAWAGRNRQFPSDDARLWFERMYDKGWVVPDWPQQYGGGGLDETHAKVVKDEMARLGCRPPLYDLGIWMLGPALLEYGTDAQKSEHLSAITKGEIRWCQGYSEPGAGSDLASLQTRAEDKGDHFLVNGSKIWTTNADKSDYIFCLVRTNPDVKKQEGISFLLIDMATQGVSASQIDLISGESEFCQVFFDNVKVPKSNLVGELNKGWSVAKSLLKHERKLMAEMGAGPVATKTPMVAAEEYQQRAADGRLADHVLRDRLVNHEMRYKALALTHFRSFEEKMAGTGTGTIPMIMKYVGTETTKEREEMAVDLMGFRGLGWEGDSFTSTELRSTRTWLMAKTLTIAGGTSEIQLNIIAKRILGLPD